MAVKFSNNVSTTLASSINSSQTSITVTDASALPALGAGDYTYVTLDTDTNSPTREVVKVTAISGTTLTVVRGQDGTAASAFAAGTKVELRLTAALLNAVSAEASATDWSTVQNKPDPTVYLSGDVTGQGTMTDLGDVTISVTVVDDSHNHTVANVDGLQTALDAKAPLTGTGTSGTWPIAISGNAATATALATARTISLTGDVTGSVSFDGSGNVSLTATIADDSHNHVISNVDGLQTALDAKYDASNPSGYVTTAGARSAISASGSLSYNSSTGVLSFTDAVTSVAGKSGVVTLTNADVGLGNVENKSSATIRGELTSANVTTALGYTPYNSTNPSGYITSSALANSATIPASTSVSANNIVLRDGNGYIYANYINFNTSESENPSISSFITSNGDGWSRKSNLQHVKNSIRSVADGTWSINITGSAGSASSAGSVPASGITGQTGMWTSAARPGAYRLYRNDSDDPYNIQATWSPDRSGYWSLRGYYNDSYHAACYVAYSGYADSAGSVSGGLTTSNYTSYAPSLTGSGASGTWGINISGSAAALNGYASAENGESIVLRTASNGYLYLYNWINTGGGGLFSSVNGAHWYPNNGSYGSWRADGTRNGWNGIEFGSTNNGVISLMINPSSNENGIYNHSYGWQFQWSSGNLYCWKNAYGGGTQATVLDSSNYTSYAPSLTGSGASGTWGINVTGTAYGLNVHSGRNNEANKVVRTDASGYIQAGWINTTSGSAGTSTPDRIYASYDAYVRYYTPANFKSVLSLLDTSNYTSYAPSLTGSGASGSWNITAARATRANGNFYIDDNYGNGIVGLYASTRYQGVFAMGDSYKLPADGTSAGNLYGIAWSYPSAGGVAGNLDSHGMLVLINGGFGSCMSYSIKASGNVTAYSDERLKTNWRPMPESFVERLAAVKVGIYDRLDGEKITQVGVSAQSLQRVLPEAITKAGDEMGTLSVSYGNAAMASAVELAKEVVQLKRELAELKLKLS